MANEIEHNYLTIQGWMISSLELKGNALLAFALIYGFTQDGETEFRGSIGYMCSWMNCSRPTVSKALDDLIQKDLIIKRAETINGVTFNRYRVNLQVVKNLYRGSKESLQGGSKETLHNNTNIDKYRDKDREQQPEPEAEVEMIPLNDGSEWRPSQSMFEEYCRLYPGVNVQQEFRGMRAWCLANPSKRKTRRGVTAFVNNWLSKSQNQGYRRPAPSRNAFNHFPQNTYDFNKLEDMLSS